MSKVWMVVVMAALPMELAWADAPTIQEVRIGLPAPKELATIDPFLKVWRCERAAQVRSRTPGKLTIQKHLYYFRSFKLDQPSTNDVFGISALGYLAFDEASGGWELTGYEDGGGRMSLKAAAAAVTGTRMTFEGEAVLRKDRTPAKLSFTLAEKKLVVEGTFGERTFRFDCK